MELARCGVHQDGGLQTCPFVVRLEGAFLLAEDLAAARVALAGAGAASGSAADG